MAVSRDQAAGGGLIWPQKDPVFVSLYFRSVNLFYKKTQRKVSMVEEVTVATIW